jgi:hypothetical protein
MKVAVAPGAGARSRACSIARDCASELDGDPTPALAVGTVGMEEIRTSHGHVSPLSFDDSKWGTGGRFLGPGTGSGALSGGKEVDQEGVGYGFRGESVDGEIEVRLAIEGQAAAVAGFQVGVVAEDGALRFGVAAPLQDGGKSRLQVDQAGVFCAEEQGQGAAVFNGAAAQSQNQRTGFGVILREKLADGGVLKVAKPGFSVLREEFGDGCAVGGLDVAVDIEKRPAQARSKQRPDRAFACAHEAGQDQPGELIGW